MIKLVALSTAVTVGVIALAVHLDLDAEVQRLLEWTSLREAAALWYIAVVSLVVILLLPGVLFTTGAGFLFGTVAGAAYVVIGTTLGAAGAFLLARHLLGPRTEHWLRAHARVSALNREVSVLGARVVLLTRLIPFFPGKLSNYAFGLTGIRFRDFVLGTFVGVIPFSMHNAYLGSLAADLVLIRQGEVDRGPFEWAVLAVGLGLLVAGLAMLARIARRALASYDPVEKT